MFITATLTTCTCYKCGITFAAPEHFFEKRHQDHATFYCPNGHPQHFSAKTPEQRRIECLESDISWLQRRRAEEERTRKCAERRVRKLTKEKERAEASAAAGACPCCHRNFKQLRRHMRAKHPEFVERVNKERCRKQKRG